MNNLYKKYAKSALFISCIILVLGILATTAFIVTKQGNANTAPVAQATAPSTSVKYTVEKNADVIGELKKRADVTTQTSSFGEYVDTINGLKGGTDGKYWMFYVNGKQASVGAGDYAPKGGEEIEWKFEKSV